MGNRSNFLKRYTLNTKDIERQQDLSKTLDQINIWDILSIQFDITWWKSFTIDTPYIKKLVLYICEKQWKQEFAPEELREIYEYVKKYLTTDTEDTLRKVIEDVIGEFVKKWWTIKFISESAEEKIKKLWWNTYKSVFYRNIVPYVFGIILMLASFTHNYWSWEGFFVLMFLWGWVWCMIFYFVYTVITYIYRNREIHTVKRLIFDTIGFFIIYFLLLYCSFYILESFLGF